MSEPKANSIYQLDRHEYIVQIFLHPNFGPNFTPHVDKQVQKRNDAIHENFRNGFIHDLRGNLKIAEDLMKSEAQLICSELVLEGEFDIQEKIVGPWCNKLALKLSGLSRSRLNQKYLLECAQAIFDLTDPKTSKRDKGLQSTQVLYAELNKILVNKNYPTESLIEALHQKSSNVQGLISPLIQLFVGTSVTLKYLLGNILLTLIPNKEQKDIYLKNPSANTNELMRIAGPAQYVIRYCLEDTTLEGQFFKKGDILRLMLSKGNQDPNRYSNPQTLNFSRKSKSHLSFGKGPHACLGSPLIRMACAILPATILTHFPKARIKPEGVQFGGTEAIRGVEKLIIS